VESDMHIPAKPPPYMTKSFIVTLERLTAKEY
jgi:hypothetical protein